DKTFYEVPLGSCGVLDKKAKILTTKTQASSTVNAGRNTQHATDKKSLERGVVTGRAASRKIPPPSSLARRHKASTIVQFGPEGPIQPVSMARSKERDLKAQASVSYVPSGKRVVGQNQGLSRK